MNKSVNQYTLNPLLSPQDGFIDFKHFKGGLIGEAA